MTYEALAVFVQFIVQDAQARWGYVTRLGTRGCKWPSWARRVFNHSLSFVPYCNGCDGYEDSPSEDYSDPLESLLDPVSVDADECREETSKMLRFPRKEGPSGAFWNVACSSEDVDFSKCR